MLSMAMALFTIATATSTLAANLKGHPTKMASIVLAASTPRVEEAICKNVCPKTGKCLDANR